MFEVDQSHQSDKVTGGSSIKSEKPSVTNECVEEAPTKEQTLPNDDLATLIKAVDESINLIALKGQKTVSIFNLALAEIKLSIHAGIHSAFVIAAIAALACFTWVLINVTAIVFATEHYNSIYYGLALSLGFHLMGLIFCIFKLHQLRQLIGLSRIRKILE